MRLASHPSRCVNAANPYAGAMSSPAEPATTPPPGPESPHPLNSEDLRERVERELDRFLTDKSAALTAMSEDLEPLVTSARALLTGGKRLRPAFCYWGWRATGAPDSDAIVQAAASLELLQASALIHDDVMDGSDTRRGLPSVHRQFEAAHSDNDWAGDAAGFGSSAAILVGDLCLSWADYLLLTAKLPADRIRAAMDVYDVMRTELMGGQYLDVLAGAAGGLDVEQAREVIRYKSAKYTIERPLHLGVTLAGGSEHLHAVFTAYGLPLGEAFQLRDDLLGVFGDPRATGKPAGDDLREGKQTVLVLLARDRMSPAELSRFDHLFGRADLTGEQVEELREMITACGAAHEVEQRITELTEAALSALDDPQVDAEAADALRSLAIVATARNH